MAEVVIEVDHLSKLYRLGAIGTGSLRRDVKRWWSTSILKKNNPYFELMEPEAVDNHHQLLWALKDISFEVKRGQTFGIIGSNGSGKSTLLKIISRIVKPTSGVVRGKGKLASLLEVGTGFHPDLTGRENIFTNGYTLGMSKKQIQSKFDEIVAFSGVERFIDTPVKRYSSGMYVRLAFSIAAHVEPDILVVDEVLAVGDADFQNKCLSKMQEVARKEGRTVIFVSHDANAIAHLCKEVIWLNQGRTQEIGKASKVVNNYLFKDQHNIYEQSWDTEKEDAGNHLTNLKSIQLKPLSDEIDPLITVHTPIQIDVDFLCALNDGSIEVSVGLYTTDDICVFDIGSPIIKAEKGILSLRCLIPGNLLNDKNYYINLVVMKDCLHLIGLFHKCACFSVADFREGMNFFGYWPGLTRPEIKMSFYKKELLEQL